VFHAQANSKSERNLQTLGTILRATVKDVSQWERSLPMAQLSMNLTVQPALNVSAYYALFGRHPNTIIDSLTSEEVTNSSNETQVKLEIDELNVLPKNQFKVNEPFDPMETTLPTDPDLFGKQIEREMNVLRQNILKNKTDSQEIYRTYYNQRNQAEASEFPVGSLVFAKSQPRASKLEPKYFGPLVVLKIAKKLHLMHHVHICYKMSKQH